MNISKREDEGQIEQLNKAMLDQISRLNDPALDLEKEIKRANALASVGNVIINTAKVRIEFAKLTGEKPKSGAKKIADGKSK